MGVEETERRKGTRKGKKEMEEEGGERRVVEGDKKQEEKGAEEWREGVPLRQRVTYKLMELLPFH